MGYTHYYPQNKDISQAQWQLLFTALKKLWRVLPMIPSPVAGDEKPLLICDGLGKYPLLDINDILVEIENNKHGKNMQESSNQAICFNGERATGMDHETFMLTQQKGIEQEYLFCKTAHKPYDSLVIGVLILVHNLCPGCFDISSDGNAREWAPICQWVNQVTGNEYLLPMGVISSVFQR